jgi:SAM-dependent methyltransferase
VTTATLDPAEAAYDALAPAYDVLTADYDYEAWLTAIERVAMAHGLAGRRVLDVACGTGKSFVPLLERGYDVTACDISEAMLRVARGKVGPRASLRRLDMRALPALGRFDLVTCLDDALNYLPDEAAVTQALAGMRANLAPRGLLVFDVNALRAYRGAFAGDWVVDGDGCLVAWRGRTAPDLAPGGSAELVVDAFVRSAVSGEWSRHRAVHRQYHHPADRLERALAGAGLALRARLGQLPGALLAEGFSELDHAKALYVCGARGGDDDRAPVALPLIREQIY